MGLRAFSMTAIETSLPGGAVFKVPVALSMVSSLLQERVAGWQTILSECKGLLSVRENKVPFIGEAISRAVSLLKEGATDDAKKVAQEALKRLPEASDLHCLLGRCYSESGELEEAEDEFQKAHSLGCVKRNLFDGWLAVREKNKDWRRVIDVCNIAETQIKACRYSIARNTARIHIGDEAARANQFSEASASYANALEDIRKSIKDYTYPADRAALITLSDRATSRWLGSVTMEAERQKDGSRRIFGACHKAILTYKYWNERTLKTAVTALQTWLDQTSKRGVLSELTTDHLRISHQRLSQLKQAVEGKEHLFPAYKDTFYRECAALMKKIELISQGS